MNYPDEPSAADVRSEALDVVQDAFGWRLAEERWQAVEQILSSMTAALANDDLDALVAATADLELASPLRIIRIGGTALVPPSPALRDLMDGLVHSIGGVNADALPQAGLVDGDDATN